MVSIDLSSINKKHVKLPQSEKPKLKSYRVMLVATGIMSADVIIDAISSDDAREIAVSSVHPEDFEVANIDAINAIEIMET